MIGIKILLEFLKIRFLKTEKANPENPKWLWNLLIKKIFFQEENIAQERVVGAG